MVTWVSLGLVLIRPPGRWYLGLVKGRLTLTFRSGQPPRFNQPLQQPDDVAPVIPGFPLEPFEAGERRPAALIHMERHHQGDEALGRGQPRPARANRSAPAEQGRQHPRISYVLGGLARCLAGFRGSVNRTGRGDASGVKYPAEFATMRTGRVRVKKLVHVRRAAGVRS